MRRHLECLKLPLFDLYVDLFFMGPPLKARKVLDCVHDVPLCDEQSWCTKGEHQVLFAHYTAQRLLEYDELICFAEWVKAGSPTTQLGRVYFGGRGQDKA
ncbi:hypothetical protein HHE03_05510 [Helicobacter heilmannii]|uniref:hypothetical protein n=1 Tax=Helicobacter heilmannii TaxID=35817 RepID=UPI0006A0F4AA|nr:hypothetical protein [Helicobacter heilmannii]GMB95202.1 hypothetical protein NHP21011_13010 [Helicobacter heilmannii]CRF48957.1 hypothetical protein HHE03_05510 [Helicobacter heilmannii]